MPQPEAPLARTTVLAFTIARAGPTAVRLLADWGADVIRVEARPQDSERAMGGRRHGSDEQNLHRNKRSLCLDLKSPRGRQVLDRLLQHAGVVVENFRADVKERLGLAYERLRAINPRIVLASISGFGQDGPYADRPGVDTLTPMGTFRARDGLINIAASTQKMWDALCDALDARDLAAHPDYASADLRYHNRRSLVEAVNGVTQRFDAAQLVQRLNPVGVPCGPIHDIGHAFEDPQARHLRMTRTAEHPTLGRLNLLRSPINLSACPHPERFDRAAPDPGQHSAELLHEAGFDDGEIAALIKQGVVA